MAIDNGLALFFKGPNSFTGEDVVEIQGHGGPVILDMLMHEAIQLGARQARAGEFSERAFLNDKMDLSQAEAIADLIDSSTRQAAIGAMRSLQGAFSERIDTLLQKLIYLRMYVEAAIDFPEEEIDFLADQNIQDQIAALRDELSQTISQASQGAILRNGLRIVLAGKPNAGKSSLLNALSGEDAAIVTEIPGTTRDTITQTINVDGLAVHILDTAGLRNSEDEVEKIGVARALKEIEKADHILMLVDATDPQIDQSTSLISSELLSNASLVLNKVDLLGTPIKVDSIDMLGMRDVLQVSALTGQGLPELRAHIKSLAGFKGESEGLFTARRRHLTALDQAHIAIENGLQQLTEHNAGELLADDLLQAQRFLGEITGEFSADDLLGEIFSGFCIGK